jgi:hypothetical protein
LNVRISSKKMLYRRNILISKYMQRHSTVGSCIEYWNLAIDHRPTAVALLRQMTFTPFIQDLPEKNAVAEATSWWKIRSINCQRTALPFPASPLSANTRPALGRKIETL